VIRQQQRLVAVAGAVAGPRAANVEAVGPAQLDVRVRPGFLWDSYALYRALQGSSYDAVVCAPGAAYCVGRAKQLGLDFQPTTLIVRCGRPTLQQAVLERRPLLTKSRLGRGITERLAIELADALVCDEPDAVAWMRAEGWTLPERVVADDEPGWNLALDPTRRPRIETAGAQPLVSVVVPFHERTEYVQQCLEGFARQAYTTLEVVVADDGSSSAGARRLLRELESRSWPWPLRVVHATHTGYPGETRNAGWREARGELVAFLDDDDIPFDDFVSTLLNGRAASGADVVAAGARLFRGDGEPTARHGDFIHLPLGEPRELGLISNQFGGPACLWPRALLDRLGGFRGIPRGFEDWELLARATLAGARVAATPDPLYWYRQTPGSVYSADPFANVDDAVATLAALHAEHLPDGSRLLPLLAAGAYAELERRSREATPRRQRIAVRGRLLARRAREVQEEEGAGGVLRRAVRFLRRVR
jgi:Glycosyl transferase family 2